MNTDINVEIGSLTQAKAIIGQQLNAIEEALAKAEAAGAKAVSSCGGAGTRVGGAINSKLVAVNREEFKKTKETITNFLESVGKVEQSYQEQEDELLRAINAFSTDSVQ